MKKAMISQPMHGKSEDEIIKVRENATEFLESQGYEVVDTYFEGEWCSDGVLTLNGINNKPLWFLAKSLDMMSKCDLVYLCKGWEKSRGCRLENEAALAYDIPLLREI